MVLNDVRQTIGLPTLLGNLAFLQDFFARPYGSNGPLWSLSYEFWFYLVFPLLVGAGSVGGGALAPRRDGRRGAGDRGSRGARRSSSIS